MQNICLSHPIIILRSSCERIDAESMNIQHVTQKDILTVTVDTFMNIMTLKIALPLKVNGKNSLHKCDF